MALFRNREFRAAEILRASLNDERSYRPSVQVGDAYTTAYAETRGGGGSDQSGKNNVRRGDSRSFLGAASDILDVLKWPALVIIVYDVVRFAEGFVNPDPERDFWGKIVAVFWEMIYFLRRPLGINVDYLIDPLINDNSSAIWKVVVFGFGLAVNIVIWYLIYKKISLPAAQKAIPTPLINSNDPRDVNKQKTKQNIAAKLSAAALLFLFARLLTMFDDLSWTKRPYSYVSITECRGDYEPAYPDRPLYLRFSTDGAPSSGDAVISIPPSVFDQGTQTPDAGALVFAEEGDWGLVKQRDGVKPVGVRPAAVNETAGAPPSVGGDAAQGLRLEPAFVSVRLCILPSALMEGGAPLPAGIIRQSDR